MPKPTSKKRTRINVDIRKADNGFTVEYSSYTSGGDSSGSCCGPYGSEESETWRKVATDLEGVIALVRQAFGDK